MSSDAPPASASADSDGDSDFAPTSFAEVRRFLAVELELNDEWQAATTIRLLRTGQWLHRTRSRSMLTRIAWLAWVLAERIWFHSVLGADLPASLECGLGVRFAHGGRGVVVHPRVRIGRRCTIYQAVTMGVRESDHRVPVVEDDVVLAAGCVIVGPIRIGQGAAVGPNAVVISDVAAHEHVVAPAAIALARPTVLDELRDTASGRRVPRFSGRDT